MSNRRNGDCGGCSNKLATLHVEGYVLSDVMKQAGAAFVYP
jgi:hypothetical protein